MWSLKLREYNFQCFESVRSWCDVAAHTGDGKNVPCQFESDNLCPMMEDIDEIMKCLESQDPTKLSFSCSPLVRGYEVCSVENESKGPSNPRHLQSHVRKANLQSFDVSKERIIEQNGSDSRRLNGHTKKPKNGPKSRSDDDPSDFDGELPCWARSSYGGHNFMDNSFETSDNNPSLLLIGM